MSVYRVGADKNGAPIVFDLMSGKRIGGEEGKLVLENFLRNGGDCREEERSYQEKVFEGWKVTSLWLIENRYLFSLPAILQ